MQINDQYFFVSAERSNKYDAEIEANLDKATAQQDPKNSLGSVVKPLLGSILTGTSELLPFLKETIDGALDGGSEGLKDGNLVDGLDGILGGLLNGFTKSFTEVVATSLAEFLKGASIE